MGGLCSGKSENPPAISGAKDRNNGAVVGTAPRVNYSIEKNNHKLTAKGQTTDDGSTPSQTDGGLSIDDGRVKKIKVEKAFANQADLQASTKSQKNGAGTGCADDDDEAKRLEEAMREADRLEEEERLRQQDLEEEQ